jgi:hypothetical protein
MKKFFSLLTVTAVLLSACVLTACGEKAEEEETTAYSYVSLKINPSVDFVVDEDGQVVSYCCANEDAEVMLSDVDLTGETIEDATEEVLETAVETGYLDPDTQGDEIELGAIDSNGDEDTETYEKVCKNLDEYFCNNGIFGKVTKETLDENLAQAEELGLSLGRTKILLLACERSGLGVDELKDKTVDELMQIIHENNVKINNAAKADVAGNNALKQLKNGKKTAAQEKVRAHKAKVAESSDDESAEVAEWQAEEDEAD